MIFYVIFRKWFRVMIVLCMAVILTGCAKWGAEEDEYSQFKGMSAQQLYKEAKQDISRAQYDSAIKQLEALETMYPFHEKAEQAELDLIYAYYKNGDYPSAAATSERFIHLYPRASKVDYAYYMKGLANFQQTRGTLTALFPIDEAWRDPGTQSQAYSDFATLVQKFPKSQYKPNALQRMIYLRNLFAKHEFNVAHYYYERRMYVAAVERANYLIKTYPQAPSAQPALALVYRGNKALCLEQAAKEAEAVYQATYHSDPMNIDSIG